MLPDALEVASVLVRPPTSTVTSVIPALANAVSITFWMLSLVVSLVAVIPVSASCTTFLAAATFSSSDSGSFAIVLLIATLSFTLPSFLLVIEILPPMLPDALEVASVLVRSPTSTVTSVIPALASAASIAFWILSLVVSLVAVMSASVSCTTFLAAATISASESVTVNTASSLVTVPLSFVTLHRYL